MFMFRHGAKSFARFSCTTIALFFGAATAGAFVQMLDLNGNGMSDIWEWVYSATNLDPNAVANASGISNLQEAMAGTDPFNPNSFPKISAAMMSGTNASISMPA